AGSFGIGPCDRGLALDRKKLAAFSALGGGFLRFPIGDRRCNRTRASVGNAGGNARPSLTNATLAASRLLVRPSDRIGAGDPLPHRRQDLGTSATRALAKKVERRPGAGHKDELGLASSLFCRGFDRPMQ